MINKRASTPVCAVIVRKPGFRVAFPLQPTQGTKEREKKKKKEKKTRFIDRISFRISTSHHVDHMYTTYSIQAIVNVRI